MAARACRAANFGRPVVPDVGCRGMPIIEGSVWRSSAASLQSEATVNWAFGANGTLDTDFENGDRSFSVQASQSAKRASYDLASRSSSAGGVSTCTSTGDPPTLKTAMKAEIKPGPLP